MTEGKGNQRPDLTPATWRRVSDAFDDALELEGIERTAYLERIGAEDSELRSHVESLLASDARADGFLEEAAGHAASPLISSGEPEVSAKDDLPPGTDVAPYRIERLIGQGGMGSVYLANRIDGQFEQRIALKVIKRGMDSDEITRRFLAERQILARLEHANIARLLDGGRTSDGRPFFAMEFVEGRPITEYADERRLTVDERVSVFASVCEAVRHAQQHLIVHRDLKPSNVLVTDEGVVKLLDFGVAKLLGVSGDAGEDATQLGARVLTPEYAAPEQLRGEPVTTATDVYALGGLLYELLSGRRPHDGPYETPAELEENVLTRSPESLSKTVLEDLEIRRKDGTSQTREANAVAEARRTSPRSLSRQLSGDLSIIVEKALRKDPAERYSSADALLGDLDRYRSELPILARRPSMRYRADKYLRRHRVAVALAALIVLALGAGYLSTIRQASETARQARRATLVKDFLVSLFADANPDETGGEDLTASDLLGRGAERIKRLSAEPEDQVELLGVIGSLYRDLGDYDSARPILADAVRIQMDMFGEEDLRVAGYLNRQAGNELLASNLAAADSLLAKAFAIESAHGDRMSSERSEILANLASLKLREGDYEEAGRLYRETMRIDRSIHGADHLEVAIDLNNYAVFQDVIGHADSAEVFHRQALAIRLAKLPRDHSEVAKSISNLAALLRTASRDEEADSLFREAISIRRRLYDGAHPDLANSLRSLGHLHQERGELDEADELLSEALAMSRTLLGEDHSFVANCYNEIGILAYQRGDYAATRQHMRSALQIWEESLPPDHSTLWQVRGNLAAVEMLIGDPAVAEVQYRRALHFNREALGPDHPTVAITTNNLGVSLRLQDRSAEAVACHRDALAILTAIRESTHRNVLFCRYLLAVALSESEQYKEAEQHLQETLSLAEEHLPTGHRTIIDLRIALGRLLVATGRASEAHPLLITAVDQWQTANPLPHYRTGEALAALGVCLLTLEQRDEAVSLLVRAHGMLQETLGSENVRTRRAEIDLAGARGR